jgi:hypothetical protein
MGNTTKNVKAATPRTKAWAENEAQARIKYEQVLEATPEEIFNVLANTPTFAEWIPDLTSSSWLSEAPYGVGSTRRVGTKMGEIDSKIIAWTPAKEWGFTIITTPSSMLKEYVEFFELIPQAEGKTLVKFTGGIKTWPLMGWMMKSYTKKAIKRTMTAIENRVKKLRIAN